MKLRYAAAAAALALLPGCGQESSTVAARNEAPPAEAPVTAHPAPPPSSAAATRPPAPKPVPLAATARPSAKPTPRPATSTARPKPRKTTVAPRPAANCHPSYPDFCIPPPPPDLDCPDVAGKRFTVIGSDPHGFDADDDGIGCES